MTSVTAGSAAVRSIEPVPPPLTNSQLGHARARRRRTAARRAASSRAMARCMARTAAPWQRLARRRVADAGDLRLVGHQPDELDARPRGDRVGRERGGLLGRVHRRALDADVHPAAQPATSRRRRRGTRAPGRRRPPRSGRGAARLSTITVTAPRCGPCGQRAQRGAVGGRVGDDEVVEAVLGQPQRLGQREAQLPAEAGVAAPGAAARGSAPTSRPAAAASPPARRSRSAAFASNASRSTTAKGGSSAAVARSSAARFTASCRAPPGRGRRRARRARGRAPPSRTAAGACRAGR